MMAAVEIVVLLAWALPSIAVFASVLMAAWADKAIDQFDEFPLLQKG
jgi:hypothetical protein